MKKSDHLMVLKFGENVRRIRKKHGLTQNKFGKLSDLAGVYIGFVERGERSITLKNVVKIKRALGCSFDELFKGI